MLLWIGWTNGAAGQDRPLWDFDTTFPPTLVTYSGGGTVYGPPTEPWSGDALNLLMVADLFPPDIEATVKLASMGDGEFVVTHDGLRLYTLDDNDIYGTSFLLSVSDDLGNHVLEGDSAGPWGAYTLTGLTPSCGRSAELILQALGGGSSTHGVGWASFDDFALTGAVCPQFVDGDADGLCVQGTDVDADGVCLGATEVLPQGEVVDCDDTVPGPACFALSAVVTPGVSVTFTAEGAPAGASVWFVASAALGAACPAPLGGACTGLAKPRPLGSAVADAAGVATFTQASAGAPATVYAQAAILHGASPAELTAVVTVTP